MAAMADMRDSLKHPADCCQGDPRTPTHPWAPRLTIA